MDKPKYYDEMSPYFPSDVEGRIQEIEKELNDIKHLKQNNHLSIEDVENVSDNYQYDLEWHYAYSELNDELKCLQYQQWVDMENESKLNALENQSVEC